MCFIWHNYANMRRPLRPKEILTFLCPICRAKPGRKCQLGSGEPRNKSHQDRRWAAKDGESNEEVWIRPNAAHERPRGEGDLEWKDWNIPKGIRY
jgi:hypothetical protein